MKKQKASLAERRRLRELRDTIVARCRRFGPQTPAQFATALLQISPVNSTVAKVIEAEVDRLIEQGLPLEKRVQVGYATPIRKARSTKTDRYVTYAYATIQPTPPEETPVDNTQAKRDACLAAARELASQGKPLRWLDITTLAKKRSGLVIAEQFLAPSNQGGGGLRPQIQEIFKAAAKTQPEQVAAPTPGDEALRQQLEAKQARIAELEAALAQAMPEPTPAPAPKPPQPSDYLHQLVEQCQTSLQRIEAEAKQLEADRAAVCRQLAAAQTLLETFAGEPQQPRLRRVA